VDNKAGHTQRGYALPQEVREEGCCLGPSHHDMHAGSTIVDGRGIAFTPEEEATSPAFHHDGDGTSESEARGDALIGIHRDGRREGGASGTTEPGGEGVAGVMTKAAGKASESRFEEASMAYMMTFAGEEKRAGTLQEKVRSTLPANHACSQELPPSVPVLTISISAVTGFVSMAGSHAPHSQLELTPPVGYVPLWTMNAELNCFCVALSSLMWATLAVVVASRLCEPS